MASKDKGHGNGDARSQRSDTFERKTFRSPRLADFATEAELTKQTGQPVANWPLVVVKELVDNALDAAEQAGTAPAIDIAVEENAIVVADRGPGIAPATVKSLVDYNYRWSSNAAYVSPTRGQQGNALQIILAMPFVLGGDKGEVVIESQGTEHAIRFAVDPVRQTPVVSRVASRSAIENGTRVTVRWPNSPRSVLADADDGFLSLASTYSWLNPHLALDTNLQTHQPTWLATNPNWSKWLPNQPTSAHWYDDERLKGLMANEIAHAEDHKTACPTVRDFIRQFRGLSGIAKARDICAALGVAERETLADFYQRHGVVAALMLRNAMQTLSRPVKPKDLGVIGEDHLIERMLDDGCELASIVYRKDDKIVHDGLPYVIEVAFGYRGEDDPDGLHVVEGFNFSPAVGGSPFNLEKRLASAIIDEDDPVTMFLHLTSPKLNFIDRGKARVNLPYAVNEALVGLIKSVTAKWTKQKTTEIRDHQARMRRKDAMTRRARPVSQKDAAYAAMAAAYRKAAGSVSKANPRQVYYVARGPVEAATGKPLSSKYFCQTLLPDFMTDNPNLTADWDIIWDNRGHFREPHTGHEIGLGTEEARDYIAEHQDPEINAIGITAPSVSTRGPKGRYGSVVYIEKEGFDPILEAAGLAERFDAALTSSKGMSVTACRMLVEELCGRQGLPLFVLHDFDIYGFGIKKTLHTSGRRYTFKREVKAIDLGLRLADVEWFASHGAPLASERVDFGKQSKSAIRDRLRINGATSAEIEFLLDRPGQSGQRIELNAMTSDQFVAFVERKLTEHGAGKVVPAAETLAETYAAFKRGAMAEQALEAELKRLNGVAVDVPADLAERVSAYLNQQPTVTWDDAVMAVLLEDRQKRPLS